MGTTVKSPHPNRTPEQLHKVPHQVDLYSDDLKLHTVYFWSVPEPTIERVDPDGTRRVYRHLDNECDGALVYVEEPCPCYTIA